MPLTELLKEYAPLNGWGTFFTAAFGAFAGAFAASRSQNKKALIAELNALSAAHALCFSIINRFLALKKQHIRPLKEDYEQVARDYSNFLTTAKNQTIRSQFTLVGDLRSLSPLATPIEALEKIVFEKTSIRGRALPALVDLAGAVDSLSISIKLRNELVDGHRSKRHTVEETLQFYLGIKSSAGIDERFRSNIGALFAQTDDCVFFARTLAADIEEYGNRLRRQNIWKYRLRVPRIEKTDWSLAEEAGLLPKDSDYELWLRGFRKKPTRIQRVRNWLSDCRRNLWPRVEGR